MTVPAKRPAYEPGAGLLRPTGYDPEMKRPPATVAGGVLVLLRAAAGMVWLVSVALGWQGWLEGLLAGASSDGGVAQLTPTELSVGLAFFLTGGAVVYLTEALLAVLILRGRNFPRMVVMFFSVLSISAAFGAWWAQGQDIRMQTTLVTVALDILVLLALSSRSAAAYARRTERR